MRRVSRAAIQRGATGRGFGGSELVLALLVISIVEGCRPPVDDCTPDERRCSLTGIPQLCVGSERGKNTRWTNADRQCSQLTHPSGVSMVCCSTQSGYTNRVLQACVPVSACLDYDSGVTTQDSSVEGGT